MSRKRQYIAFTLCLVMITLAFAIGDGLAMPGNSCAPGPVTLTPSELAIKKELHDHVSYLSEKIGVRTHLNKGSLERSVAYIRDEFSKVSDNVRLLSYRYDDYKFSNVELTLPGTDQSKESGIVVIGAHYDSVVDTVGADDNASGVAALLVLASTLSKTAHRHTIKLVAFPNEEMFFRTPHMGSYHYAAKCKREHQKIIGMLALETIGTYSDVPGSQNVPPVLKAFYPDTGNFIAFISTDQSKALVKQVVGIFRQDARIPSQGCAAPAAVPGMDWSDHLPFLQMGYPALMVTDTALYRNANYHTTADTIEKLDFDKMTLVVSGLDSTISKLAR